MFQDSVPAGSYNDPFLSSVCVKNGFWDQPHFATQSQVPGFQDSRIPISVPAFGFGNQTMHNSQILIKEDLTKISTRPSLTGLNRIMQGPFFCRIPARARICENLQWKCCRPRARGPRGPLFLSRTFLSVCAQTVREGVSLKQMLRQRRRLVVCLMSGDEDVGEVWWSLRRTRRKSRPVRVLQATRKLVWAHHALQTSMWNKKKLEFGCLEPLPRDSTIGFIDVFSCRAWIFTHTHTCRLHMITLKTRMRLHTEAFTHRNFYAQKLLRRVAFTQRSLYTEKSYTHHRGFYRERLLQREVFYTEKSGHRGAFTEKSLHKGDLHTEAFTHRHVYTQNVLQMEALTAHRNFYT